MTAQPLLTTLLPLVADLSRELPEGERYRRLLQAMRALLPCDAAALLRLDGEWLVPLAVDGLSADTLGRRFKISEHPRFEVLLGSPGPTRFDSDSELPDPYDGLVDGFHGHLEVHDCMGCPLFVDDRPWGLLTLDALDIERFERVELDALQAFASLAAATVNAAERIERLAIRAEDEHQRAEIYRQASGQQHKEMIGQSKAHKHLVEEIKLVGGSDLTVLITGETGVGKELVAQAIHAASPRAEKPLISLNCAALPETLVESELFGHVRGAFTGALNERRGKFELANGGTLFLDEVGELSLTVQAKLLRVLQSGQLQRLGSDQEHQVDVRLIAATNRDLAQMVQEKQFRADLYYRLKVFPIFSPPLRERLSDIPVLVRHFVATHSRRMGKMIETIPDQTMEALVRWPWPGNIRELENFLERAVILTRGPDLYVPLAELETKTEDAIKAADSSSPTLHAAERDHILRVLRETDGQIGGDDGAAARLGLKRTTLNSKIKKLGIERNDYMKS